jgi:hypothetical protein
MKELVKSTEQLVVSSSLLIGITVHTGIVGDKDDLLVLDQKIGQELTTSQATGALYEIAKLKGGRPFVSWQPVEVDLNFNNTGKLMISHEHFGQYPCEGEVIHCTPNDKLIEYVKNRYK